MDRSWSRMIKVATTTDSRYATGRGPHVRAQESIFAHRKYRPVIDSEGDMTLTDIFDAYNNTHATGEGRWNTSGSNSG